MTDKRIPHEMIVAVDIDNTLLMWTTDIHCKAEDKVSVTNPYTGKTYHLRPHHENIRVLKEFVARGYYAFAWSGSGGKWADAVVKALGLDDVVGIRMTKFVKYMDDDAIENWAGKKVYLPEE